MLLRMQGPKTPNVGLAVITALSTKTSPPGIHYPIGSHVRPPKQP